MGMTIFTILATGLLGVIGWFLIELRQKHFEKKVIDTFLIEVIKPVIVAIAKGKKPDQKSQIDEIFDFVDLSNGSQAPSISHFPLFNSNLLKSFPLHRLRITYGSNKKFVALMNITGYLDGFQGRMPNDIQKQWSDFINKHQKECEVDILKCSAVKEQTKLYQENLDHTREMAKKLMIEINTVINKRGNKLN